MVDRADIVVIGAGIMGCSIAYHLALRGAGRIVVIERDRIGRGSTSAAAGGVRLQFSTPTNIELSKVSLDVWENFREIFGVDVGLHQQGYLILVTEEAEVDTFQANVALQQSLGVPSRWLGIDEIRLLNSSVRLDDVLGASYCPRDGWADPYSATTGFARAARDLGVEIRERTAVSAVRRTSDRVDAVVTADGDEIQTGLVIVCAGPHSRQVGEMAGVEIPISPFRRMSFTTRPFDGVPSSVPFTIDFASGLYFHPEGPCFLFGMADPDEPSSFDTTVDNAWMMRTIEALCDRAPAFERATVHTGWAGLYEVTPDHNPVLGYVDGVDGLLVAAGFSGHGFMQGPAIGMCMAELIVDGSSRTIDIREFRPSRFREGRLAPEHNVI
jgi:sarcosine oxidase, subunit beta